MKSNCRASSRVAGSRAEDGSALILTVVIISCALVVLAATMAWSNTSAKQTDRANRYMTSTAAAEAATEFAVSKIVQDFRIGGEALVRLNLTNYQSPTLSAAQSAYWSNWEFNDSLGHTNATYVNIGTTSNYTVLNSVYARLHGYSTPCVVISDAHQPKALNDVVGAVYQQIDLVRIPIFQWAMFSSGDMEISCGKPFTITGPVHSNQQLYVEPDDSLTFLTDVTAVGDILFQRHPLDSRGAPSGSVNYGGRKDSHVPALTLPIGLTNTPTAVREIIEPPLAGEDPNSPLGIARYYNNVDLLISVTSTNIKVRSGRYDNFSHTITNTEAALFVSTNNSFWSAREGKWVMAIDIDVGKFRLWSATNGVIRPLLGNKDVSSIYVHDKRPFTSSTMSGVRVLDGVVLPSRGLTVATGSPLYVWGNFNSPSLGSSNTSATLPASLVGDALTVLSQDWQDVNSATYGARIASALTGSTTVNAAILAGAVDTVAGHYSGGMENFPRFLEDWSAAIFTYNGSMVKMFPSLYATNFWDTPLVYSPPTRNWTYDRNFDNPAKLPPLTPSMTKIQRSSWNTLAANSTNAPPPDL